MKVIKYLKIENFRSIRSIEFTDLEDYNPIIGLNSAGKSNILRALNLFFNGMVDENKTPLDFSDDFSSHAPTRKKKHISITVGIGIGDNFQVPHQKDFEEANGIDSIIYIRRTWNLAPDNISTLEGLSFGPSSDEFRNVSTDEQSSITSYIRAVRFVYIPNHARPADLIRSELTPLRANLVSRLRRTNVYRESAVRNLLDELGRLGERMFGDISEHLANGIPGTQIAPDLPDDFADLIFDLGVNAISETGSRAPEFEGSGAQSFMLLHVLDLADRTRRSGGFGWVQASVWAIEEPESFLHAGLRARFSSDLHQYSTNERRQVFLTTHQDEFVRVGEHAWMTDATNTGTVVRKSNTREALAESTKRSITSFQHPLFLYTDAPIVIVEGKWDQVHLRSALAAADCRARWRLLSPSQVFGPEIGGDGVLSYLRYNKNVIASRPDRAPVIVLRDWEDKERNRSDHMKVLQVHKYSTCLIPPENLTNPRLDDSFVGIERFLPTDLIESCIPSENLGLEHAGTGARYRIQKRNLELAKSKLALAIENGHPPGDYLIGLAKWIDRQVEEVLEMIPAKEFQ